MAAKMVNEMGVITISDQVITTIASNAAMQTYGIVGLAYKNAKDGLLIMLRKDNMSKGVTITTQENRITIDLTVVLEYGVRIAVVCENIIDTVRFNVENQTGLIVDEINVLVQDMRMQNV